MRELYIRKTTIPSALRSARARAHTHTHTHTHTRTDLLIASSHCQLAPIRSLSGSERYSSICDALQNERCTGGTYAECRHRLKAIC